MITPLGDNLNLDGWSTEDGGQLGFLPRGRGAESGLWGPLFLPLLNLPPYLLSKQQVTCSG